MNFRRQVLDLPLMAWMLIAPLQGEVKKILEKTLFESSSQRFRYSEGSILSVDGSRNLLMVVSVYGTADHDVSSAQLLAWRSHDGGLTWKEDSPHMFQENIGKQSTRIASFLRLSRKEVCFSLWSRTAMLTQACGCAALSTMAGRGSLPSAFPTKDMGGWHTIMRYCSRAVGLFSPAGSVTIA